MLTIGTIRRLTAHLPDDAPVFPSWDAGAPEDAPQVELLGFGIRKRTSADPIGLSVVLAIPEVDEDTGDVPIAPTGFAPGDDVLVPGTLVRKSDPTKRTAEMRHLWQPPGGTYKTMQEIIGDVPLDACFDMQGRPIRGSSNENLGSQYGFVSGRVRKRFDSAGVVSVRIRGCDHDYVIVAPECALLRYAPDLQSR